MIIKKKLSILVLLPLIIDIHSIDYGFYYDNSKEEILFNLENTFSPNLAYKENDLLTPSNIRKDYYSSAKRNKFKIEYYSCPIYSISSSPITLIKASFNVSTPERLTIKEIIMDLYDIEEKTIIFPKKYNDEFSIQANKTASNHARKKRNTIIYDTFGFKIISKSNYNFKIAKLLLVNFRKKKLNYLANLSRNVQNNTDNSSNIFDIYLENLPENFDLYITLELYDKNWKDIGEKILVVQKDFNYPNYRIKEPNPNKTFFIFAIVFILITLIITIIFVLLKFICGCFFFE
jgi:hypothetical protein